ncbi:rho guanine nucleotide exchange factor 1 isoform X2 [Patagioenas fasciata]
MAFVQHSALQFDCCPLLCYLHAGLLRGAPPKEAKKQLLEFSHLFLDKGGLLRVPLPHQLQVELERWGPELGAEELQRLLLEIQSAQEPEVTRQLQDFRSKRLLGMTPGEAELAELESYRTRDRGIRDAKEKQLAELLLGRLEDVHLTISSDEDKSAAIFASVASYLRSLGVRARPPDAKKPKANFFRKKISVGRRDDPPPKSRRGFTLPGAALWGRDPHGAEFRATKGAEGEAEKPPPPERRGPPRVDGGAGGVARPRGGTSGPAPPEPPPGVAITVTPPPPGDDDAGPDPPPEDSGAPPPRDPPPEQPRPPEDGGDPERLPGRLSRSQSLRAPPQRKPSRGGAGGDGAARRAPPRSRSDVDLPAQPRPGAGGGPTVDQAAPGGPEPPPPVLPPPPEEPDPEPPPWRQMVPPERLRALSKSEVKRQEVINELFLTEHAHVRMLRVLLQLFCRPMLREGFFEERELHNIFPSLEELLDVHALFLEGLRRRREESGFVIGDIGDLLLATFGGAEGGWFRKLSARFCSRQPFALEQLKAKQRKDPRFCHFIQEAESQPRCRRLQLRDIIPTEMQRLTKYPLLLHSVAKCTEAPGERARVEQAAECCRQILDHVNQEVRDMENLMKLKDYQRRLDLSYLKQSGDPLLSEFKSTDITKRTLVHEGPLTWRVTRDKAVEVQVLLLDELLVLLQRQEERLVLRGHSRPPAPAHDGRRTLSPVIRLRCAITRDVATDPRAFYVIVSWEGGAQIYELVAQTAAERRSWCTMISQAAGSLKLPGGPQRGKGGQGGPPGPQEVENAGTLKEPLPLEEREKEGAGEGTEALGGPPPPEQQELQRELSRDPPPSLGAPPGGLAEAALETVSRLQQLLPPLATGDRDSGDVIGAAGDVSSDVIAGVPPEQPWGGPDPNVPPPTVGQQRDAGDGAESEEGGAGSPPRAPPSPPWGPPPPAPPALSLPPPQAAWLAEQLRGLQGALRGLQELEQRYWHLRGLLDRCGPPGGPFT